MKKKEELSKKDKVQWEEYLKDPKDIFDKELDNKTPPEGKYRFSFDLHGFKGLHSNTDQNTYVSKELSKIKFSVQEYINSQKDLSDKVYSIKQASTADGGEGALIIKLKKL